MFRAISTDEPRPDATVQPSVPASNDHELLDAFSSAVIGVVEATAPAVVSIEADRAAGGGNGSGLILSADGWTATNSHVIGDAGRVLVETADGDRLEGIVAGRDPSTDLALIRLRASDLPVARLGESSQLRVGQLVVAIGSPLGLAASVSTGIVSATGRSMRAVDGRLIENIVQHSAPINPGNSGGPLVDSRGRVAGINTAIIQFAQNLGFAVPCDTLRWVASEIRDHGQVRRQLLGIAAQVVPLPRRLRVALDLLTETAVAITSVLPDGLAARAGLTVGDLIVAMDGHDIENIDQLHRLLNRSASTPAKNVTAIRNGRLVTLPLESRQTG